MAKKLTKREAGRREWEYLKHNPLTDQELHVIRKLNGSTFVEVNGDVTGDGRTGWSRRTIEAVLQGRRSNPEILQRAIHTAMETLERYTKVMNDLLEKLTSSNDTTG